MRGGKNLFAFVGNQAVRWVDPFGLEKRDCTWKLYAAHLLSDDAFERGAEFIKSDPKCGDRFGIWSCADNLINDNIPVAERFPGVQVPPDDGAHDPLEPADYRRIVDAVRDSGLKLDVSDKDSFRYRLSSDVRPELLRLNAAASEAANAECGKATTCCKSIEERFDCTRDIAEAEIAGIAFDYNVTHRPPGDGLLTSDVRDRLSKDAEAFGPEYRPICNTTFKVDCADKAVELP